MNASAVDVLLETSASVGCSMPQAVLTMVGEHDISTVDTVTYELGQVVGEGHSHVLVDLSGVTFMDASIVNLLLLTTLSLRSEARDLFLRAPSPTVRRLLDLCENISPLGFHFVGDGRRAESSAA